MLYFTLAINLLKLSTNNNIYFEIHISAQNKYWGVSIVIYG